MKTSFRFGLACALWLSAPRAHAQEMAQEVVMDAAHLAHALDRASNTARVLYIAAHPDDENTRLLAYLANGRHVHAAYLSMTRGGGGQNLIGAEKDTLLDVLRTQELLAARRIDGALQRFTSMRDFGYSKSAQETLSIWGHERALADVVYVLRSFQPDVVITRFNEEPPNHGHHTASAILARQAFSAAADPKRFPQQLALGVKPWQAKRLLYNLPHWRHEPVPPGALELDVGGYDARLGLSYGELAARSRSQHKSQGFGATPERGPLLEHFVHVAGTPAQTDLLDGVAQDFTRFGAAGQPVAQALTDARQHLHRDHPERALPGIAQALAALSALPQDDPRVRDARAELQQLMAAASGLFVRATADRPGCVPGERLPVKLELVLRRPAPLVLRTIIEPDATSLRFDQALAVHAKLTREAVITCPKDAPLSTPYWLSQPPLPGRHVVDDLRMLDDPQGPPPLNITLALSFESTPLSLRIPVLYAFTDRVQGEREQRVLLVPPATVTPVRDAVMLLGGHAATLSLRVRAGKAGVEGRVLLELPPGYRAQPPAQPFQLARAGDDRVVSFAVSAAAGASPQAGIARPVVEVGGHRYGLRQDSIDYPHVPPQVVLQPASVRLSPVQLSVPKGLIGYVEGSGDSVASDLAHVGAQVEQLSDADLLQGKLDRFAAIVLGVRAYNTRAALRSAQPRLMRYVEQGGTLLVQYVTRSAISPLDMAIGPYPLEIGRGRVTDEHAALRAVDPKLSVLHTPNDLGPADFEGWVQERGLYFAEHWDPHYQPVFELADPGEPAQRGALLIAHYGRGRYIYTGLSFFRQLPAGVPGAYRLLLNLLAKPSKARR